MSYVTKQIEKWKRVNTAAGEAMKKIEETGLTVEEAEMVPEELKKLLFENRTDRKEKFKIIEETPKQQDATPGK